MLDFTKLDITKTNIKYNNYSGLRDSGPKSCQGRPQLLETFKPSYALSKAKNENSPSAESRKFGFMAHSRRCKDFGSIKASEEETQIMKLFKTVPPATSVI